MTYDIFDFVDYLQDLTISGEDIANAFTSAVPREHLTKIEQLCFEQRDRMDVAEYLVTNNLFAA